MTDIELSRGGSRHVGRSLAHLDGQTSLQAAVMKLTQDAVQQMLNIARHSR